MKKFLIYFSLASIFLFSCTKEKAIIEPEEHTIDEVAPLNAMMGVPTGAVHEGQIIIKVSEKVADSFSSSTGTRAMGSSSDLPDAMDRALTKIKVQSINRLFPNAGKFEERTRREGLHRWLKVEFDKSVSVGEAINSVSGLQDVEVVEFVPITEPMAYHNPYDFTQVGFVRDLKAPFNDPDLSKQWHYNNDGSIQGSVVGADINLYKAWEITTGTPNVTVCVVDGGIDVTHSDLMDNLWVNEKEKNGTPGVDDDGNGYIDDINGYCFVVNSPILTPDKDAHGTHVAGTVAARNNNSIGVCGVAGGDGSANSGVRIMSAAIFSALSERDGNHAAAIKYGADNGAVISQNSWTFPPKTGIFETPESLKAAIDYFVKYAGCDNEGNQLPDSPMKGGVVMVAAGNFNSEYTTQPASYEKVIAVTAMGPDFVKASYSNYGDWADIMASGGDMARFNSDAAGVYSTISPTAENTKGKMYAYYQGTSMACPHVSGVAALVVSKFGGPGFTNEMLKERLFASVYPINIDEVNPKYAGKLGVGYIDAYAALTVENKKQAPEKPVINQAKTKENGYGGILITWAVPADKDDGAASRYKLYYSEHELNASNLKDAKLAGNANDYINGLGRKAGEEMQYEVAGLTASTEYYFALIAYDRWGLASQIEYFSAKTKFNAAPEISNLPKDGITLLDIEGTKTYELLVNDKENHKWDYVTSGDLDGVNLQKSEKGIVVTIRPVLKEGNYKFNLTLTDEIGTSKEYEIPFRIVKVRAPELRNQIPAVVVGVKNAPMVINLKDFFTPQEFFTFAYTADSKNQSIVTSSVDKDGKLTLKGIKSGKSSVLLTVSNGYKSTTTSMSVSVTNDASGDVYSIWPQPIRKELNIWLNPAIKSAKLELLSVSGEVVFTTDIKADASGIARVNMKNIAPGSYTLRINTGKEPFIKSVLKM